MIRYGTISSLRYFRTTKIFAGEYERAPCETLVPAASAATRCARCVRRRICFCASAERGYRRRRRRRSRAAKDAMTVNAEIGNLVSPYCLRARCRCTSADNIAVRRVSSGGLKEKVLTKGK